MSSESATGAQRFAAVDYVKALAIFAVVVTHAGYPISRGAISTAENLIRHSWVSFHVPAFLVMAGFLYYRAGPIDPREAGRRLVRVLIPYAIASLALYGIGVAHFQDWERLVFALATGNAVGEYYFVFVLLICIPWIVLLSRAPAGLLWGLSVASPPIRPSSHGFRWQS